MPTATPLRPSAAPSTETVRELAALFREHASFVWRSARRMGVPEEAVDDVVQDVFVVVAQRLEEFEGRAHVRTWLFAILVNVVRGQRRTTFRRTRRVEALAQAAATQTSSPQDHAVADRILLQQLLDCLDDDRRSVYVLSELEGFTAQEIADGLQLNVNTVYSRLKRAKDDLRAQLTSHLKGDKPEGASP